ncbi:hypothetical protein RRU94_03605 [Domibacillus sp. DTU_2020_1001157_1_SI_ALB_TIR_016]|uniref:hypothetical protein n=1 Tax=Domibacillus sp. DTU_2020_1001157_1_SI_ALB_TIR_016 TaxID=3077789 RepID=UPI0028EACC45|nr:hypothetical protein [Domibacillus sp. DTU_2020_1001157_1_SI_ALB_TIR_016]WNS79014.1 hypothetical protein RRU94_03605 [Domibacillus sp. DTU_2020_1001157_1_SI_ALB_TIR_016]
MKKIILWTGAILFLTAGCSYDEKSYSIRTLNNMTYVKKTEIKNDVTLVFTQPNGVRRELYWNDYKDSFLVEDKKYDIDFMAGDKKRPDRIVHIELSDATKEKNPND